MHPIQPRNFFDRCIEAIAPKYAASRYSSRAQIALARSFPESSYRGAVATRSSTPWSPFTSYRGGSSADRYNLASIADRAERVYRDNPVGRGLLNAEVDNIVAEGFSLQMRTISDEFNREAEGRFYRWLEYADVSGKLCAADWFRTSWREPRKSGDGGIVLILRGGSPKLQYIPRDLICNPRKEFNPATMFDGVECDPSGKPIRFWIRDVDENGKDTVSPIDARDFVYLAHLDGPLSVRGVSVYSSIFGLLDQLDSYVDAVTKAAIMAAIFGLIEKRRNPAAAVSALGTLVNSQGDQQKAVTLENGMLKVMGTDETMFQVQASQPMQQTPDFIRALMRLICLAFDMPIEIGQKDLSQVNFSGGRIGLIGYYRSCRVKQDWLKSRCWNRVVFWWLSIERQRQQLGYPDAFKSAFPEEYGVFELHGREWDYNDPQTEIVADLIEMDAGVASPQQVCEKRGRDWRTIQEQISESRKVKDTLGIPTLHSTSTRDERTQVTAVDANGNPVSGDSQHLNGAQITAAVDVLSKSREGTLSDLAAAELLAQIGVPLDRAKVIVNSLGKLTTGTGDVAFKREVLKQLLSVPASREAVYNATDIEDLIMQTGLSPEKGYEAPYIPVVASTGPLVSGAVIYDPEGDIVGGDVENDLPDESVDLEQD